MALFFMKLKVEEKTNDKELRIAELQQKINDLKYDIRFSLAEIENIRKRMQQEVDEAKKFGVEKFVKNLFVVSDTMNICLHNKPNFEELKNSDAEVAFNALENIKHQLATILKDSYGIEEVLPEIGENFDPTKHNALFEVDPPSNHPNLEAGTVGVVIKSGWKRGDSWMRHASVGVVKQQLKETNKQEDHNEEVKH